MIIVIIVGTVRSFALPTHISVGIGVPCSTPSVYYPRQYKIHEKPSIHCIRSIDGGLRYAGLVVVANQPSTTSGKFE